MNLGLFLALAGAAIAISFNGTGSSIGIGYAAGAASGAMSENPKLFGKLILLVALPGTQGIYGFVVGFLTLQKIGLIGGQVLDLTVWQGLQVLFMCLPVALSGLFSAIHQGKVCASGINMVSKQESEVGKALVMGVLVEFYAVLGLLSSIFVWMFLQL
jgi:V/A-type H+/Na+-transporting ATPase subunit K